MRFDRDFLAVGEYTDIAGLKSDEDEGTHGDESGEYGNMAAPSLISEESVLPCYM